MPLSSLRAALVLLVCLGGFVACGPAAPAPDGGPSADGGPPADAGTADSGADAGGFDAGAPDAGLLAPVDIGRSLFWNDGGLLDDATVTSFPRVMAAVSDDGHGGRLLEQWFDRFNTTAHSERALPAQFLDAVRTAQGTDARLWNLSALPFVITGLHNRIDLLSRTPGGHCGELRVSASSTDVTLQPFHILFLFRQPAGPGDTDASGAVTCAATAKAWADLSALSEADFAVAVRARFAAGFTRSRFLLAETVEFSLAPWEWRQWLPTPAATGPLPFVFENPPLFQQLDITGLNQPGARRDDFLAFVEANAAALNARALLLPERFRPQSVRQNQGVPRTPLSLNGVSPGTLTQFPSLRQQLELVGCAACHTADAEFVQTRSDRTVSPFYEKELKARAALLEALVQGNAPAVPFGPLQASPRLPD